MNEYIQKTDKGIIEELKLRINDTVFFSLDAAIDEVGYRREKYKLVENVAKYMFATNEEENTKFGSEIWELTERCIRYYDKSGNTPFLTYFLGAWAKEHKKLKYEEQENGLLSGMHVPEHVLRAVNSQLKRAKYLGVDCSSMEFVSVVAQSINWNLGDTTQLINQITFGSQSMYVVTEENEEFCVLDIRPGTEWENPVLSQVAEIDNDSIKEISKIDECYKKLQPRQKPVLSKILTLKIVQSIDENDQIYNEVEKMSFFNEEIRKRWQTGEKITHRIIADECNTTEQQVSRSWNSFLNKLRGE